MKPFEESDRYNYPLLNAGSLVLDCGVYQGAFSKIMAQKYDCRVIGFEPVRQFFEQAREELKDFPKVQVINHGVGGSTRDEWFDVRGDTSGLFMDGEDRPKEKVVIIDIVNLLDIVGAPFWVDLLKLNIERMEYEVLGRLVDSGAIKRILNIQVQFHSIAAYKGRELLDDMHEQLRDTHEMVYGMDWVWEGWRLREKYHG